MSLLLARGLWIGGIQTFPAPLDFLVTRQRRLLPAELSKIPSQPLSRYTFLSSSPPLWRHKISPELLPCTLGLDCGLSPAGAVPVL